MSVLYLDCFAGISGNMLLGALIDAGLPEERLRKMLAKLPVSGYELMVKRVEKQGISAVYVDVRVTKHQHHRHLPDILQIIETADLPQSVKDNSKKVFMRLAEAEAKVHNTTLEDIHFHEVGAVDAIVDVVGTVFGLYELGVEAIYTSKLHVGSGFVQCNHGMMPVPAPATAELLCGIPYYSGDIRRELVTPTGAAVLAALGTGFGGMPEQFICRHVGYGAGTWDIEIPNVLRMVVGELGQKEAELLVVEANIDDMNPQHYAYAMDRLFAAGALDVWLTPIVMKKGRPATTLSVLVSGKLVQAVTDILFAETTTIGVRHYPVERTVASRATALVDTQWGGVRIKISKHQGRICNFSPEFDDCLRLAKEHGVPLKAVRQAATHAAAELVQTMETQE